MFDNLNIMKAYKITDNINGHDVEIATFNAMLIKESNININMVINYPKLYVIHKEDILSAYKEFNAEVSALAITMGLANELSDISKINELKDIKEEITIMTKNIMEQVLESLGDIRVNPIPTMEVGSGMNHYR